MLDLLKDHFIINENAKLPPALETLDKVIESGKSRLLQLEDDYDGEGSQAPSEDTVKRATDFIKKIAFAVHSVSGRVVEIPKILPGPGGSVDVCWKTDTFQLLVNFPENREEPASYYGDDYGKNTTEGLFDVSRLDQVFLFWLIGR